MTDLSILTEGLLTRGNNILFIIHHVVAHDLQYSHQSLILLLQFILLLLQGLQLTRLALLLVSEFLELLACPESLVRESLVLLGEVVDAGVLLLDCACEET